MEQIENGKSINDLIKSFNDLNKKFNKTLKKPLTKQMAKTLAVCGLKTTPGAGPKQAFLGAVLAMGATTEFKKEQF